MKPVQGFKQFQQSIYTQLPEADSARLAQSTIQQPSFRSAYQFYRLLGKPASIQNLSRDQFEGRLKKDGQVKALSRLRLALCHFGNALTARYHAFGTAFQERIQQLLKKQENGERPSAMERASELLDEDEIQDKASGWLKGKFTNWFGRPQEKRRLKKDQDHDDSPDTDSDSDFDFDD